MSESIPVHIVFVLDRSGSMETLRADVIGGFNRFLDEQKAQAGKCRMTFVQFDSDDPFELLADASPIADVAALSEATFRPRGMTPLLDAEGKAITRLRTRAAARKSAGKKDEAVLFVTYTDGMENHSREWTHASLSAAKKECEEAGWTFLYLGVGHDAYGQSASVGSLMTNTSSVVPTAAGVSASFDSASHVTSGVRSYAAVGDSGALLRASKNAYAATDSKKADEDEELRQK